MQLCYSFLSVILHNPQIKASSVFSTQLMTPHANGSQNLPLPDDLARLKPDQVQVVTKELRVSSAPNRVPPVSYSKVRGIRSIQVIIFADFPQALLD